MRFQKAIKRMVALGTGALMLSSAYAAADLSNYPAPFIKDGKFSGVLVVGDKAAAEDVIGITDIVSSLQAASVKKVSSSSGGVDVSFDGDAWKVGTSTKTLELTENLDAGTNRESIATITSSSFIDDNELSGLLASGQTSNSKGSADYEQRLYFEDTTTGYVFYTENNDDVTSDFLYFASGKQVARYEMEFTTQLESDVDDSSGSASSTGTYLTDLEDVEFNLLGKTFQVVTARRGSSAGNGVILTLMGGAVRDTLLEGNTKTYTVDGKDYEVTLNYVDSTQAQFVVNGQTTRKLNDGDSDKLSDGTTMGVSEILYQDYAGGIHSSTFFIGAQKVELRDTNIRDTASSNELKVDDETIDGVDVTVEGTDDNTTFKLDKIGLNITGDDDFYVPVGGKLSETMSEAGSEADALFTRNWDVEYKGLSKVATSEISVKASGSDDYNLMFTDGRGNSVKVPLAHADGAAAQLRTGDQDDDLVFKENSVIVKDDYFLITDYSDNAGERQSFALRYRGADRSSRESPLIKFDELGSNERIERPVSVGTGADIAAGFGKGLQLNHTSEIAQIKLGGGTFRVYNASTHLADDFNIFVDLNGLGSLGATTIAVDTKEGAEIALDNTTTAGSINVSITTQNTDDYDDLAPSSIIYGVTASSGEVRLARDAADNLDYTSPQGDDDNEYTYTSMGAFVKFYSPSSDPQEVVIEYPAEQRVPLVYVTGKSATFTETEVSSGDAVQVQRIEVGAAKLASEVSDVKAQNTLLVGGPCANAAAAAAMGNPADCTAGFEPGVGVIQLWEHSNGNVAMLVAGYSAVDTRNTAQVVANYKDYKSQLKGMKVEVKKVNNQLTVAQPVAKVVETTTTTTTTTTEETA